jgi:cobalt-precorrin-7 (C5)-methyltransferase
LADKYYDRLQHLRKGITMIIVGVGCGPGLITVQAAGIIFNAKRVAGSSQALSLAEEYIQEGCKVYVLQDYFKLEEFPEDTVILCTGDPTLVGLKAKGAELVPGISSLQVAFARLDLPLESVSVVCAQGKHFTTKAVDEVAREVKRGKNVFVLADPKLNVSQLAEDLGKKGIDCQIAVLENLGYDNEKVAVGSVKEPPVPESSLFCLVLGKL